MTVDRLPVGATSRTRMQTYEVTVIGGNTGRIVRGWARALQDATVTAARRGDPVEIWRLRLPDVRDRRLTVFPDGTRVFERPLHCLPPL